LARIRTIKPEFFTSEDIVSLSPMARLLYVATWCEADKEGRLIWKPRTFKLRYFPGDECDIEAMAAEITKAGLVVIYGDELAYIPAFGKHQHINPRESASILPAPSVNPRVNGASARVNSRIDAQGGREGKGKSIDASTRVASAEPTVLSATLKAEDLATEGVDLQRAKDWLTLRKAKRLPLTRTAWDDTKREGAKAGLTAADTVAAAVANNWAGFKAAWYAKEPAKVNGRRDIFAGLEK
jgi:hypothetical protein